MQYILSQTEYDELQGKPDDHVDDKIEQLEDKIKILENALLFYQRPRGCSIYYNSGMMSEVITFSYHKDDLELLDPVAVKRGVDIARNC